MNNFSTRYFLGIFLSYRYVFFSGDTGTGTGTCFKTAHCKSEVGVASFFPEDRRLEDAEYSRVVGPIFDFKKKIEKLQKENIYKNQTGTSICCKRHVEVNQS
jgi:hypothetical protein